MGCKKRPGPFQDPKDNSTFVCGRWKSETNPDLAFSRTETCSQLSYRRVLGKFPWSQHRPSLITASHRITTTSEPVKCWNFRKANWKPFGTITYNIAKKLRLPDARNANTVYQAFCSMTINAAKQCAPSGKRKLFSVYHAGIKNAKLSSKLPKPLLAMHQIWLLAPWSQDLITTGAYDGKRLSKT